MSDAASGSPGGKPHVYLIGLPGAGKSTVGQAAAKRIGVAFVDLDLEVAKDAGMPVAEIFETLGEAAFRAMELEATLRLPNDPSIVAPGGGWITNPRIRVLVQAPGPTIYLRVSAEAAALRLGSATGGRPLLAENPVEALRRLLTERREEYEKADATIDTERFSIDEVIDRTAELASAFLHLR